MSDHCLHCDGCREGFGYAGNGLVYSREALIYDGWAHHCFIDGAGYLHWDEGRCPLCATAQLERASIVAWLRSEACFTWLRRNTDGFTVGQADDLSVAISDGEHLRGDDE